MIIIQVDQWAHLLPSSNLLLVPNPRHIRVTTSLGRNESSLSDQQRPRRASTLRVVFDGQICVYVLVVRAESCEGREDYPVLEIRGADFDGLEERRGRLRDRHRIAEQLSSTDVGM